VNVPSNQYLPGYPDPEFNPDASNDDPSRLKPDVPSTTTTQRNVLQTRPTQAPVQPQPTQRPYQPQPQATQRPFQPQPTQRPVQNQPTQRPYQPQANQPRPSVVLQDQAISIVPSACSAAMNCTPIEYCDAIGTISKTLVTLSDFQKEYRVPMTDCMMPSKELGKCCRDPDYTDPWPIGRSGAYVADELNAVFDSGAYKPERQKAAKRSPQTERQASASSNQIRNIISPPTDKQNIVQQRPNREIPTILEQTNVQQVQCGVRNYVRHFVLQKHLFYYKYHYLNRIHSLEGKLHWEQVLLNSLGLQ
jgi:hypothetical protein